MTDTTGVTSFLVDPYQLGHENEEAIESGSFWFYYKLGFVRKRPTWRAWRSANYRKSPRTPNIARFQRR